MLVNTNTIRPTEILGIRHSFSKALLPLPMASVVLRWENAWFIGTLSKHGKNNWSTDRDGPKPTRRTTPLTGYRLPAPPSPKGQTHYGQKVPAPNDTNRHTTSRQAQHTKEPTAMQDKHPFFLFKTCAANPQRCHTLRPGPFSSVDIYRDRQLGYTPRKPTRTCRLNEDPTNGVSTGCTGLGTTRHFSL